MDILEILEKSGESLLPEDFDFFENEIGTGDYSDEYKTQCQEKLQQLCVWRQESLDNKTNDDEDNHAHLGRVNLSLSEIAPKQNNPSVRNYSQEDLVFNAIDNIRKAEHYKSDFKDYVQSSHEFSEDFLGKNLSYFDSWEVNAIVSVKQLSEDFLDKYFSSFDPNKIAMYQFFSESFFMKHYAQFDPEVALKQGKNDWCKKENRSKQLDVFLRLKGVKI